MRERERESVCVCVCVCEDASQMNIKKHCSLWCLSLSLWCMRVSLSLWRMGVSPRKSSVYLTCMPYVYALYVCLICMQVAYGIEIASKEEQEEEILHCHIAKGEW